MRIEDYAALIDHTNLHADATNEAIEKLCEEAVSYGFKMVAINQTQTAFSKSILKDTPVNVGAAIAFPLGQTTIEAKYHETLDAIENGADEIDYVINIGEVKNGNYEYIRAEMEKIVTLCREHEVVSKVIFENCYLDHDEIKKLCEIALEVEPDFIKTSTGFGPSGATLEDVQLMIDSVKGKIKVKAAGGIRDAETFLKYVDMGVNRVGTSNGIKIIEELKG